MKFQLDKGNDESESDYDENNKDEKMKNEENQKRLQNITNILKKSFRN